MTEIPLRVLLVEDSAVDAELVELELVNGGYLPAIERVETAAAMRAALEEKSWDVVLSDYGMPRFSGLEALELLKETHKDIPFILISGSVGEDTAVRAMKAGAQDFFVKGKTGLLVPAIQRELQEAKIRSAAKAQHEQTLDALSRSEERFRLLVNAVQDYAIFMVDPEGRIATWNSGAERLTAFTAEEVLGEPASLLYPADGEPLEEILARVRREGSGEWDAVGVRKDGSQYVSRMYWTTMAPRGGQLPGYVSIIRDITEQRSLEAQLAQAQKLESLGQLAGGVAHDFNNMLTVILVRTEVLLRQLENEKHRQFVQDIRTAAMKNRDLTQQLLGAARRQVLEPQVVALNDVIATTMRLLGPTLGEHVTIRTVFEPTPWYVYADPGKLHQVLMNLAINARDAMPQGGTLTIESRNVRLNSRTGQHVGLNDGDYATLIVSDTGTGIPKEVRDRIYDPFFTTKEPGKGTGLGLAVVRGIIEQTGGRIWLYSEEDKGATFKVFLPRHASDPQEQAAGDETLPGRGQETILVVEDEELVLSVVRDTLEEHGYRVIDARNGVEALSISRRYKDPIHLLLTDSVMPGMTGTELAEAIIRERPGMPVILMSGYSSQVVRNHDSLPAEVQYLEKPIQTNVLLRTIREALGGA